MGQNVDILTTDNNEVQTAGSEPAKKVRVGYIFLSVIPVAVLIMIQSFCQIPFFFMAGYDLIQSGQDITSDAVDFMEKLIMYNNYNYIVILFFFLIILLLLLTFIKKKNIIK